MGDRAHLVLTEDDLRICLAYTVAADDRDRREPVKEWASKYTIDILLMD